LCRGERRGGANGTEVSRRWRRCADGERSSQVCTITIMAQVDINIGSHKITAVMTRDALDELGLLVGDTAVALVKETEVMVIEY